MHEVQSNCFTGELFIRQVYVVNKSVIFICEYDTDCNCHYPSGLEVWKNERAKKGLFYNLGKKCQENKEQVGYIKDEEGRRGAEEREVEKRKETIR